MHTQGVTTPLSEEQVLSLWLHEEPPFPNNPRLPALIYHQAFEQPQPDLASAIERTFAEHDWRNGWRNGVYTFHHFHSTAHEVLGCYGGRARVQLGGPGGPLIALSRGDVLVIPAGVAHRADESSADFAVVGCYAGGQRWDMCAGDDDELSGAQARIARVALPTADPVHGRSGPLIERWTAK